MTSKKEFYKMGVLALVEREGGEIEFLKNNRTAKVRKTPPFCLRTNLYWNARCTLPKRNKKPTTYRIAG